METLPVIAARQLAIGYSHGKNGSTVVHRDLSFDLWAGELTCLLGPNGAGKSTLLRTLSAFQLPLEGELWLEGRPLRDYSEREKSRKIGVVLTDKTQAGGLTVYELVSLGRQPHTGFWGRLNREDHKLVEEALTAVGISHKAANYVAELSDGERQKVMIAKALVQECPLILLDEPTAFLDVVSRIEIMTLLHTIAREQHKTILLSTHDIDQALIQEVVVRTDDPCLWHWCVNALNRFGYSGLPGNADRKNLPVLTVTSPHEMSWEKNGMSTILTSFEDLTGLLKK